MEFKRLNTLTGWIVFAIATTVYFMTLEPTVSLWDCGEYITTANKLEVGHPPGAPLFMMIGRLFSFFAGPEDVAAWINRVSALSSSFTILFMFWTITMFAKKIATRSKRTLSQGEIIAILGSGAVGALAYTFSDSFWFSAVEAEVYSMASFFTALVFWAIMKWDTEEEAASFGETDGSQHSFRWIIFIFFMVGLAIGVHLLGLLIVPSIAYVIYFRRWKEIKVGTFIIVGIIGVVALYGIQEVLIPKTISLASSFEIFFRNDLGLPFNSGIIFFFIFMIGIVAAGIYFGKKHNNVILHTASISFLFLLIGYATFATIVIRSNANTPLDENDPENPVTLVSYLKREQYGSAPLLSGKFWNSNPDPDQETYGDRSPIHLRRFVVITNDVEGKSFKNLKDATAHAKKLGNGSIIDEKYVLVNEGQYENQVPTHIENTLFPRMFSDDEPQKIEGYKSWSGYNQNEGDGTEEIGKDGKRIPTMGENLTFFARYQMNHMYWRYFMWNFAGRQNDIQGHGGAMRGNWASGFGLVDDSRIGKADSQPTFTSENKSYNTFYLIPLILGLIGLFFHFYKSPKDAFIILLTFLFTGLAIVVYLNQKPLEPRERDYAYAASFYAFAMWIGMSVYAMFDVARIFFMKKEQAKNSILNPKTGTILLYAGAGIFGLIILMTIFGGRSGILTFLVCIAISAVILGILTVVTKNLSDTPRAIIATSLALIAPIIMMKEGWDDHDRSDKTSAHDLAYNYLVSCTPNSILFTVGDNDTFPLWYLQEVEGKFTSIRVANLSLMSSSWYSNQMKLKAYDSEPLPINFTEDQLLESSGGTDQVLLFSYANFFSRNTLNGKSWKTIIERKINYNIAAYTTWKKSTISLFGECLNSLNQTPNASTYATMNQEFAKIISDSSKGNTKEFTDKLMSLTFSLNQAVSQEAALKSVYGQRIERELQEFGESWDYLPAKEAMAFVQKDENMMNLEGNELRVFPSSGFYVPVNAKNAVKAGIISADLEDKCHKQLKFRISENYLFKADLMMLEVIANNDWKRGILFSSAYNNSVSKGLLTAGYIKRLGMCEELTPVLNTNQVDKKKMYDNLMNKYHFGKMYDKNVLTDYYTRRGTQTFRNIFNQLAASYANEIENAKYIKRQLTTEYLGYMRQTGQFKQIDSLQNVVKQAETTAAENKLLISKVLNKSLAVMPPSTVLDLGEPEQINTKQGVRMSDGTLQEYVRLFYVAGDIKAANKLGLEIAQNFEKTIDFFYKNDAEIIAENSEDLFANIRGYGLLLDVSNDPENKDENGALAKRTQAKMARLFASELPNMLSKLQVLNDQNDNLYESELIDFQGQMDELKTTLGYAPERKAPVPAPTQLPKPAAIVPTPTVKPKEVN